jgi:hypothetical protein
VVQKSSSTTFPLTDALLKFSPLVVLAVNRGAGSFPVGPANAHISANINATGSALRMRLLRPIVEGMYHKREYQERKTGSSTDARGACRLVRGEAGPQRIPFGRLKDFLNIPCGPFIWASGLRRRSAGMALARRLRIEGISASIPSENHYLGGRPMNLSIKIAVLLLTASLGTASAISAQEKRIKREELPPPVEKTVAQQAAGATVRGFSKEVEKGKTYYEAELTVNGHGKDVLMDELGNIVEVEDEVSLDSLPAAVQQGLRIAAGAGKIGKVESLTKNGKLVAYEAVVKSGEKRSEVQVSPEGKKLAHPE